MPCLSHLRPYLYAYPMFTQYRPISRILCYRDHAHMPKQATGPTASSFASLQSMQPAYLSFSPLLLYYEVKFRARLLEACILTPTINQLNENIKLYAEVTDK